MKKILFILLIAVAASLVAWFLLSGDDGLVITDSSLPGASENASVPPAVTAVSFPNSGITDTILINVPFAAQAPFGNWSDPRQQDGCEEASALMAMYWLQGKTLTPSIAEREILAISDWEQKTYGSYHDTSAEDTNKRILQGYFHYNNGRVKHNVTLDDIKAELRAGNIMIAPMNGKALNNPNFTAGGPDRHMLVIIGYDPIKKQIITHDPGTRQGKNYRYGENLFFTAMRDYATGYHEPITGGKAMIVVKK